MSIQYTDTTSTNPKMMLPDSTSTRTSSQLRQYIYCPSEPSLFIPGYDNFTVTVPATQEVINVFNRALYGSVFDIKKVIFNPPATVIYWEDGTKTVVKASNEDFDPEKGLAMAIAKKALGNQGNYYNTIRKWIDIYEPKDEPEVLTATLNIDSVTTAITNFDELVKSSIKNLAEKLEKFGGTKNVKK